jgi:FixJ family two-component response regulator
VAGSLPDTRLYLSVMEGGAFDFIAPPFEHSPLKFVVRSAALNTYSRRDASQNAVVAELARPDFIMKAVSQSRASPRKAPMGGTKVEPSS